MKTRNIILIAVLLVLAGAAITAFFFLRKSTAHLRLLPKHASVVMKVDNKKLARKTAMTDAEWKDYFEDLEDDENWTSKADKNLYKKMAENPLSVGIDIVSDIYGFYLYEEGYSFAGATVAISDKKDFQETLTDYLDDQDLDYDDDEKEKFNTVTYTDDADNIVIWDKEKALFLTTDKAKKDDLEEKAEDIFTQDKEASLLSNANFRKFNAHSKDISFWFSSELLEIENLKKTLEEQTDLDLDDIYLTANLEFEQDKVTVSGTLTPNEDILDRRKEWNIHGKGIPASLLTSLPYQSYITLAFSLNPDGIYDLIKKDESFVELKEDFKKTSGISMKQFFNAMGGNCIFSIHDFEEYTFTEQEKRAVYNWYWGYYDYDYVQVETKKILPSFALVFDLHDSDFLDDLLEDSQRWGKDDDYYFVEVEDMRFYVSSRDSLLALSNDRGYIKDFAAGGLTKSLEMNEIIAPIKGASSFAQFNLRYQSYPESIQQTVEAKMNPGQIKNFKKSIKPFSSLQYRTLGEHDYEITLLLNNKSGENSLKVLLDKFSRDE